MKATLNLNDRPRVQSSTALTVTAVAARMESSIEPDWRKELNDELHELQRKYLEVAVSLSTVQLIHARCRLLKERQRERSSNSASNRSS